MKKGIEVEAFYCKENCNKKEEGKIQFNYAQIPLPDKAKIYLKNRGVPFDYGGGEAGVCNTADDF